MRPVRELLFAVLAAAVNALSSVLQRKATLAAPADHDRGLGLIASQLHQKAFFAGMVGLIVGFLLQAAALSTGQLSVVQPILVVELPFTLFIAGTVFRVRVGPREWLAAACMSGGLALALAMAAPSGGERTPTGTTWALIAGASLGALMATGVAGWRSPGPQRAALLGVTAGGLFGLTATFMAAVTVAAQQGPASLFAAWQLYAMLAVGVAAVYVLQNAFQAGSLAIAQPGVTLTDPVLAVTLGVVLFGEHLRLGWRVAPELLGLVGIGVGMVLLAQSPLVTGHQGQDEADRPGPAGIASPPRGTRRQMRSGMGSRT